MEAFDPLRVYFVYSAGGGPSSPLLHWVSVFSAPFAQETSFPSARSWQVHELLSLLKFFSIIIIGG